MTLAGKRFNTHNHHCEPVKACRQATAAPQCTPDNCPVHLEHLEPERIKHGAAVNLGFILEGPAAAGPLTLRLGGNVGQQLGALLEQHKQTHTHALLQQQEGINNSVNTQQPADTESSYSQKTAEVGCTDLLPRCWQ
jgi:hypothetical protein